MILQVIYIYKYILYSVYATLPLWRHTQPSTRLVAVLQKGQGTNIKRKQILTTVARFRQDATQPPYNAYPARCLLGGGSVLVTHPCVRSDRRRRGPSGRRCQGGAGGDGGGDGVRFRAGVSARAPRALREERPVLRGQNETQARS